MNVGRRQLEAVDPQTKPNDLTGLRVRLSFPYSRHQLEVERCIRYAI